MVALAIALLLLSSTTPLIVVFAGFPGDLADAVNVADSPAFPVKLASTTLVPLPACGPSVNTAMARPLLSVDIVWLGTPAKFPPPGFTVNVTGTFGTRLNP